MSSDKSNPTQFESSSNKPLVFLSGEPCIFPSIHPSVSPSLRLSPASSATWVRLSNRQSEQQHQLPDSSSVFVNRAIFFQTSRANIFERVFFLFKKRREVLFGWRRRRHGTDEHGRGGQTGRGGGGRGRQERRRRQLSFAYPMLW